MTVFLSHDNNVMTFPSRGWGIIIIMALQPFVGPWPLFSVSWSYTHSVGPLGCGISPSQGVFLRTEQHKHNTNAHNTNIHALSGIRAHDPSVRASEDSSCLRPRGHRDRRGWGIPQTQFCLINLPCWVVIKLLKLATFALSVSLLISHLFSHLDWW
jgi:hypothetical protein